jgi:ubiquinone/menaquinone biosynthesis C-methylase UbiE
MDHTFSELDLKYFNQFKYGYFPYTDKDLNIILVEITQTINRLYKPKICEVGCGSGQFSKELSKRLTNEHDFYGIDISEVILEYYPFNKINASAFNIPVEENFFDVICYPASLHHLYPFEEAIKEMDRILKPDGFFYCLEPNYYHLHRFLIMKNKFIYQFFRKANDVPIQFKKLSDTLSRRGFNIIYNKYTNIEFKEYSLLQQFQNKLSSSFLAKKFPEYVHPWFIVIAQKKNVI